MEIRTATGKDIPKIVTLLEKANDEFGHKSVPFSKEVTRNTVQRVINHQNHEAFVIDADGELKGIIVGLTNQLWYSRKRQVADLIYYVEPDTRGYGARLLSSFMTWARETPNVAEIQLGISSGTKDMDRVDGLLRAVGLKQVGGIYNLHPAEEKDNEQCA